jgi:beta-glucosidase
MNARVSSILRFLERVGKFQHPETLPEQAINQFKHRHLIRKAGSQGTVLLKNEKSLLPLNARKLKSVAALGLAKECLAHGGGSAAVNCHYEITPYEALHNVLGNEADLRYAPRGPSSPKLARHER